MADEKKEGIDDLLDKIAPELEKGIAPKSDREEKVAEKKPEESEVKEEAPKEAPAEEETKEDVTEEAPKKKRKRRSKKEAVSTVASDGGERSIGEILKEEGLIPQVEEAAAPEEEKVDMRETVMKIEKLDAQVTALKDIKFQADERIRELAESIGELRSLLFQRDAEIKETITKMEKLEEVVSDIEPEKIIKELDKKSNELDKNTVEIEKLDKMLHDMLKKVEETHKILDNVKSMENLIEVSKDLDIKITKMEHLNDDSKRTGGKVERFYLELERRLSQLNKFEERLDKLDELTKELTESSDKFAIEMKNIVNKEDLETMVRDMIQLPDSGNVDGLMVQKNEIETMLKNLEGQFKSGIISEESYDEVVSKNAKIIAKLEDQIKEAGSRERPESLQSWLDYMDKALRNVETKQDLTNEKMNKIELGLDNVVKIKGKEEDDINKLKMKMSRIGEQSVAKPKKVIKIVQPPPTETQVESVPTATIEAPEAESLEVDEIKSFLTSLEDEYRRGLISEDTYREVKERNIEKMKDIEDDEKAIAAKQAEKVVSTVEPNEIDQLKNKIELLKAKGINTTELENLVKMAAKNDALGFSSISKLYLNSIKEKMMEYDWS